MFKEIAAAVVRWIKPQAGKRGAGAKPDDHRAAVWIQPHDLEPLLSGARRPVVIDVRGADEFSGPIGHIPAALNIPVGELPRRLGEIGGLDGSPIVLVCRTDKRSASASALLRDAGLKDVRVLRGGMELWNREIRAMASGQAGR